MCGRIEQVGVRNAPEWRHAATCRRHVAMCRQHKPAGHGDTQRHTPLGVSLCRQPMCRQMKPPFTVYCTGPSAGIARRGARSPESSPCDENLGFPIPDSRLPRAAKGSWKSVGFRGFPENCSGPGLRAPPGGVPVWGRTRATCCRIPSGTGCTVACRLHAHSPFRRPRPRRVSLGPDSPEARLHFFLGDGLPVSDDAPACAQAHVRLPQCGPNPSRGTRRIRAEAFGPGSHGRLRARPDMARASIPSSGCPTRGGPPYWPGNATRIPAEAIGPLACPDPERLRRGVNLFRGRMWQLNRQYSVFVLVRMCRMLQE